MKEQYTVSTRALAGLVRELQGERPRKLFESAAQPQGAHVPDLWRGVVQSRAAMTRATNCRKLCESAQTEPARIAITNLLDRFVDDYCGTPARRWVSQSGNDKFPTDAVELLSAAAEFHRAATQMSDGVLKSSFAVTAHRLLDVGIRRLEHSAAPGEGRRLLQDWLIGHISVPEPENSDVVQDRR